MAQPAADAHPGPPGPTDGESRGVSTGDTNRAPASEPAKAAPPVPLRRFEDLLFDGQVIEVAGITPTGTPGDGDDDDRRPGKPGGSAPAPRAATGINLGALDRLGMLITFAFERRRQNGLRAVVLPGDEDPEGARGPDRRRQLARDDRRGHGPVRRREKCLRVPRSRRGERAVPGLRSPDHQRR